MSSSRPRIGLNTTFEMDDEGGISATRPKYWEAVLEAGGLPLLLPQLDSEAIIEEALAGLDGFVLIGGYDVPGERFGRKSLPAVVPIEPRRERTDFALIEALLASAKPTLAICLGFQEINIARGGTLYQDLPVDAPPSDVRHFAKSEPYVMHEVQIAAGSRLAEIMGSEGVLEVNSTHHQALDRLGDGVEATASAPDGIVEAIEIAGHPFCIGVQWHPEMLGDRAPHRRLFEALIEQARD